MKRIYFVALQVLIVVVLPLIPALHKILSFEVLYLVFFTIVLNYTQPGIEKGESERNQEKDSNTMLLIISATIISAVVPVVHWAYFPTSNLLWVTVLGVALNLLGLFIRYQAISTLGKFFTATVNIHQEHQLVRSGIYRNLRHPSYTGAYLSMLGLSLVFNSLIGLATSFVLMSVAYHFRIKREEQELQNHFGEKYKEYKEHSWRMIPFIW